MNQSDLCQILQDKMGALFHCTEFDDCLRIRTPYLYPDGDNIDLFCAVSGNILTVTDLAETTGWLWMQSAAPRRSPRQNRFIAETCATHGVEFYQGMLQARCRPGDDLAEVVTRVAQAALRVSDLWFTLRYAGSNSIANEVAEYLSEQNLDYERSPKLPGRSTFVWNVDFHVRAAARSSLVYVLTTGNRSTAHRVADHVVAAWYDLSQYAVGTEALQFVSLFDDTVDIWTTEDISRVEALSTLAFWSKPEEFSGILSVGD